MAKSKTGLLRTLRILYASYGGVHSLVRSEYFYVSVVLSLLCWRLRVNGSWSDLARSILPTLSGFSIAAYAIFFAVLDERTRDALRAPAEALENRSPLLILASSISHAVVVQLAGLVLAIVFLAKPFPAVAGFSAWSVTVNVTYSALGLLVTLYGIVLVMASILSIFRILEIRSRA